MYTVWLFLKRCNRYNTLIKFNKYMYMQTIAIAIYTPVKIRWQHGGRYAKKALTLLACYMFIQVNQSAGLHRCIHYFTTDTLHLPTKTVLFWYTKIDAKSEWPRNVVTDILFNIMFYFFLRIYLPVISQFHGWNIFIFCIGFFPLFSFFSGI